MCRPTTSRGKPIYALPDAARLTVRSTVTVGTNKSVRAISSSSSSSLKHKKTVRFANHARVKHIPNIADFSDQEWKACWYTPSEFQRIREDIKYVISLQLLQEMQKHQMDEDARPTSPTSRDNGVAINSCLRGLEFRLPEGYRQRQENKEAAWNIVFQEQAIQWEYGRRELDLDDIAKLYHRYSRPCQKKAVHMAHCDAIEVATLYRK